MRAPEVTIDALRPGAFTVPTESSESDGALSGGRTRVGSTDGRATTSVVVDIPSEVVVGCDAMAVSPAWQAMVGAVRNVGRPGVAGQRRGVPPTVGVAPLAGRA